MYTDVHTLGGPEGEETEYRQKEDVTKKWQKISKF